MAKKGNYIRVNNHVVGAWWDVDPGLYMCAFDILYMIYVYVYPLVNV